MPAGERNYRRFQDRLADSLRAPLPGGSESPLAKLHPYRLHRVYLAASRLADAPLDRLSWLALETEVRLKGESGDAEVALTELVAALATGMLGPGSDGRVTAGRL